MRIIEAQHSATGLDTIAAVRVTDDGVERQEWGSKGWLDIQYAADLMPSLLEGLISPSTMTKTFFWECTD